MKSLLETAYALQQHLDHALPPNPNPHPLALESTNPLESIAQLRQHVQHAILQLQQGLAHFPTAASDRYLTQLRDAAASEAALLALGRRRRKRTRNEHSRDRYRVPTPRTGKETTTLRVLEQIAAELNLVTFRDHEQDDDEATPVTLSLGGKLMVVDVTASSTRSNHIQRVKVAYVVNGLDKQSTLAATKLEHLFATSDDDDDDDDDDREEEREEREQTRWKGIRRMLSELKDVDEMADRTGRDAFQELEQLNAELEAAFVLKKKDDIPGPEPVGASAASIPTQMDRLLLQPPDSLYPIVIYHATPFAQLDTHWARLVSSSSSLTRFEIMEALLPEDGDPTAAGHAQGGEGGCNIYAVQLELGPLPTEPESQQSPSPKTTTTAAAKDDDNDDHRPAGSSSLFLARLIPMEVPIHPETGRAVLQALGLGSDPGTNGAGADVGADANASAGSRSLDGDEGEDDYAAKEEEEEAAGVGAGGEKRTGRRRRTRTALAWMRAVTRGGQSVMQNDDGEGVTYEQAFAPSTTTSRPLLLRYQSPTIIPSASSSPSSSAHNTTTSLSSSDGGYGYGYGYGCYEASYLAFRSVPHLIAALGILARQTRLNELLRSVVDGRYGSVVVPAIPSSPSGNAGHAPDHDHGQGEACVKMMSLDELFAPPSTDTPLVVPISIGTGLGPGASSSSSSSSASPPPPPPTFSLTFPFPALEAAPTDLLGLPLSLQFSLPLSVVTDNTLPSSSPSSKSAAEEELITTKFVAPDQVVRSLLGGEEARRELEARAGRVVCQTGVVGLAVEEVVRTLRRAIAKVSGHPE